MLKNKLFIIILILLMLFILPSCNKKIDDNIKLLSLKNKETKVSLYCYTPDNFEFNGTTTPLIIVLANSKLTNDNISNYIDNGFKDLAEQEKCNIVFVDYLNNNWTKDDIKRIDLIMSNSTETWLPNIDYSKGINNKNKFYSSHFRKYIFAVGKDTEVFCKTYLTDDHNYMITDWSSNSGGYAAGYAYLDASFEKDNIFNEYNKIKNLTRTFLSDGISYSSEYIDYSTMLDINKYKVKASNGKQIEYTEFIPNGSTNNKPLVVIFHGRGSSPETYEQQTKWPLYAYENDFVLLSITGPYDLFYSKKVSTYLTSATNQVIQDYVSNHNIDKTKVYLSGFSMGAYRTLALGQMYPENYSGICINNIVTTKGIKINNQMPMFILLGTNDFYYNNPKSSTWYKTMIEDISKVNNGNYIFDNNIDNIWGYSFDNTKVINNPNYQLNINILNENTYLVDCSNLSHNVLPDATEEIVKFFKLKK